MPQAKEKHVAGEQLEAESEEGLRLDPALQGVPDGGFLFCSLARIGVRNDLGRQDAVDLFAIACRFPGRSGFDHCGGFDGCRLSKSPGFRDLLLDALGGERSNRPGHRGYLDELPGNQPVGFDPWVRLEDTVIVEAVAVGSLRDPEEIVVFTDDVRLAGTGQIFGMRPGRRVEGVDQEEGGRE